MIGISSSIVASEISASYDTDGSKEEWIKIMWIITNISTLFLSNILIDNYYLVASIVAKKILYIRWMKSKKFYTDLDNLFNTGLFKFMIIEILLMLVMPYPSLYNHTYQE